MALHFSNIIIQFKGCVSISLCSTTLSNVFQVIANENAHILGIRDTESVKKFQQKLKDARRLIVVGNGGIATELV